MKSRFFFTYGSEGYPYRGGWTTVWADDYNQACELFCLVHPRNEEGFINCAGIYTEEDFQNTGMFMKNSNLGKGCVEVIEINVVLLN